MASKIFISYRRDDSAAAAGRLNDRLEQEFGRESLFMDVDAIPFGVDFVEVLSAEVAKCDVLLAIIGPSWLDARDEDGNRRLDSEHDFVRIEIAAALNRNIPVIPILLEGTRVPKAERLPDELKSLARRNALDVRHASFRSDMDRLVRALRGISPLPAPAKVSEAFEAKHSHHAEQGPEPATERDELYVVHPTSAGDESVPPPILAAVEPPGSPGKSGAVRILESLRKRAVHFWLGGAAVVAIGIWAVTTFLAERKDAQVKESRTGVTLTGGQHGSARGWFGIAMQPVTKEIAYSVGMNSFKGALIADFVKGSSASASGLKPGDVILGINGERIEGPHELAVKIAALQPDTIADVVYWREGSEKTVTVMIGSAPIESPSSANAAKPGSEFTDCANDCPVMIVVPPGKFIMGSPDNELERYADEGPQREVTITKPFAVSKYLVTFAEWDSCASAGACPQVKDQWGRGQMPVINVSFDDAKHYADWLSRATGKAYRLLTEAEWEYAARAGTKTRYYWGDDVGKNNANCSGCGSQWDNKQTAPVGSFQPNAFGLYDMAGNVWEWCEDVYHENYRGAPMDGSAWIQGSSPNLRAVRGGSWNTTTTSNVRAAARNGLNASKRDSFLGFRVARTLTP